MIRGYVPAVKYGNRVGAEEENHSVVTVQTNGTTPVNVFGGAGTLGMGVTISDVVVTSLDTTAGNITVENPLGTVVATIAKGASAGVLVGAISLANTTVLSSSVLVVKSSTAGNALVKIFFTNTNTAI